MSSLVERKGISMNDYNTSGQQHVTVHVAESLDLEIAGEHVGQLFLRGWDGWGVVGGGGGDGIWTGRTATA